MRIGGGESSALAPSLQGWNGEVRARDPAKKMEALGLSPEARAQVTKLKAVDQQVRAHEAAHLAAGGDLVRGGPTYTYQVGPDGHRYAVGGEVTLDASPVQGDPQATIAKAEQLRAAALAPSNPSAQDRTVAAQAAAMASQAALELAKQKNAYTSEGGMTPDSVPVGFLLDWLG